MICQKKLNICINKLLFTILNDFLCLFHPKPVQNIITIKPPCMYSAYNDVTYFGGWENINKFTKSLNVSSKWLKKQYVTKDSLKTSKTHKLSM